MTSPPYWGLRDYGVTGQIGLEPTPEEYLAKMVAVFREVRRVLRPDGVCWVNMGDSYNGIGGPGKQDGGPIGPTAAIAIEKTKGRHVSRLKPKDLCGIPWRLALAMQADGWYLRSDIIWHKPNPMPESVRDRPTKAHEYVFLMTKSARYFYDAEAVREEGKDKPGTHRGGSLIKAARGEKGDPLVQWHNHGGGEESLYATGFRNSRSVWTITPRRFKGAHFATFPPELASRCIKAGTSEHGCCPTCGKCWERVTERTAMVLRRSERTHALGRTRSSGTMIEPPMCSTLGFRPSCDCPAHDPVPCIVLDPFAGVGTVGMVASQLGRASVGIELNPDYCKMARKRIRQAAVTTEKTCQPKRSA